MAATKSGTAKNLFNAQTVTAGAGVGSVVSGLQTLTTAYGSLVMGEIVNDGTALGAGCTAQLLGSNDGTKFYTLGQIAGGTAESTTYPFSFGVAAPIQYCELALGGPTTHGVTVTADITNLTGI